MIEIYLTNVNGKRDNTINVFNQIYKSWLNVSRYGVKKEDNVITINNKYAQGKITFYPFSKTMALYSVHMKGTVQITYKIEPTTDPEYYLIAFSLNEATYYHKFVFDVSNKNGNAFGNTSARSVYYASSDVQSYFSLLPGNEARIICLRLPFDELSKNFNLKSSELAMLNPHCS